ncbi:MAG: heavy-metal-associated domain-containing protein [Halovenus sp.]
MTRETLAVSGMACSGCEDKVVNALVEIEGVSAAEASHAGYELTG